MKRTAEELTKLVSKDIAKKDVRQKIEQKVGDDKDLIKLVNMRVAMLERLVLVLASIQFNLELPQDLKDKAQALTQTYINMYVTGQAKDTIDLADYADQLNELIGANNTICQEVEEYRNKIQ